MTINEFSAYLGVRPASVSNHAKAGFVPRSYAVIAILLGEAADRGVCVPEVLSRFGVTPLTTEGNNVRQIDMFRAARDKGRP